jgi:hypothetical protein
MKNILYKNKWLQNIYYLIINKSNKIDKLHEEFRHSQEAIEQPKISKLKSQKVEIKNYNNSQY